jgi:hypothetical protein
MIERRSVVRIGHFGAHNKTALSHGGFLQKLAIEPCREKYLYEARIGKSSAPANFFRDNPA